MDVEKYMKNIILNIVHMLIDGNHSIGRAISQDLKEDT